MNKITLGLIILINIIFYTNTAISKVVTNKIFIGTVVSITGEHSSEALLLKEQYDIAVKNINNKGGVKVGGKTYQFEIIYYDDESNKSRANNLIKRLIHNDGVQFIIVPHNLKLFDNVKNIIKKYQITITSPQEAISNYKIAFESTNFFDGEEINKYLQ